MYKIYITTYQDTFHESDKPHEKFIHDVMNPEVIFPVIVFLNYITKNINAEGVICLFLSGSYIC